MIKTSVEARTAIVRAVELDLVGPGRDGDHATEILRSPPSHWYLTGFLVPKAAGNQPRKEEPPEEELDAQVDAKGTATDDAVPPEPAASRKAFFPSSIGLSVLLPASASSLTAELHWGDYVPKEVNDAPEAADSASRSGEKSDTRRRATELPRSRVVWQRIPCGDEIEVPLKGAVGGLKSIPVRKYPGVSLYVTERPVQDAGFEGTLPKGTRAVSVFIVNERPLPPKLEVDPVAMFQVELQLHSDHGFIAKPNLRVGARADADENIADLQYREVAEYAVGHGVSVQADSAGDQACSTVRTCWMPRAEVERIIPSPVPDVPLGMEALGSFDKPADLCSALGPLVTKYREWLARQRELAPKSPKLRAETAADLATRATAVAKRIETGIGLLAKPDVFEAFRIANRAMAIAARRREQFFQKRKAGEIPTPAWYPFQLAFILMNLPGISEPTSPDREVVDLLFFPTGGGKTEAYLGLAAFTLVLRRLRNPGLGGAGVSVLMRYTLRLLTLDQLGRASAVICALELERRRDEKKLGEWPFEIGLWVGRGATPNRMGQKGDRDPHCAYRKWRSHQNNDKKPAPVPLEECPWCAKKFSRNSFVPKPTVDRPTDLKVRCVNPDCPWSGSNYLPLVTVDEPIYRRLPCFLIATVDKFAAMPWVGEVGAFFGRVQRSDRDGFYGACEPTSGKPLPAELPPPDLIIQDELHLISGPMGTMTGLYETALDRLASRTINGHVVRPKVVASTATVKRAESQVRCLFARQTVDVFPPLGHDRRDSFFARTVDAKDMPARIYVGVAAQGRSQKVVLLRTSLALLAAGQKVWNDCGGDQVERNPADPYMTMVGYFNSLRELGGSRRIVEDEIWTRLRGYGRERLREGEVQDLFANRNLSRNPVELTSRVSTNQVAEAKRLLALAHSDKEHVDVALATNMISVGLDIKRLGLMVVLGQPKATSEYIQATSRVGRDESKPGLVVTLLNIHRPRDRSHYERFKAYHRTFYRSVESSSVTPFSPRALDRGLAGTLVALARLGYERLTPGPAAAQIGAVRGDLKDVAETLAARAQVCGTPPREEIDALARTVRERSEKLLDTWRKLAARLSEEGGSVLHYTETRGEYVRLLYEFLSPALRGQDPVFLKFRANRSMRDVEPNVNLWLKRMDNVDIDLEEEDDDE